MLFIVVLGVVYHLSIETAFRDLQHANAQKEILLKEIHHRIKNNLNKMSSALGLQILRLHRGHTDDPEEILRKNKLRIEAMALVHEALYQSKDLANVNVDEYMHRLLTLIDQAYDHTHIVTINASKVTLSPEKILRLGTILNELYTNTLKHTDPDHSIHVDIHLTQTDEHCTLTYHQSGHPNTIDPDVLLQSHGLGMMLIRLSVQEMNGKLTMDSTPGNFLLNITFPC
jgi:two-component sensor histidine kinase